MMLVKLNAGEGLEPAALAQEFGVNLRTIQRDINERFGYLPIEKIDGVYRMPPAFLGRLSLKDIDRFAALAGVAGLFPSLSVEFLRDIFDSRIEPALLVKGHHYEDLRGLEPMFRGIEQAISEKREIHFSYRRPAGEQSCQVEPYKLVNAKGIWYLAARHNGRLKTYSFSKISAVLVTERRFEPDPTLLDRLHADDGIWISDTPVEAIIAVEAEVAPYFRRRKLIANQIIEQENPDGSLRLRARVGHPNQILAIVRYWIPHLRIVAPLELAAELERSLRGYLETRQEPVDGDPAATSRQ